MAESEDNMRIKAKYRFMNTTRYKYFHNLDEMNAFFEENKVCKFISYEEGNEVESEASSRGYK